jgi:hypothetical protein
VPRRIRKAEAWPSVPQHDGPCERNQVSQEPARASHQHAPAQNAEKPCRHTHYTPILKGANTMLRGRLTSPRSPLPALRARSREPGARSRPKRPHKGHGARPPRRLRALIPPLSRCRGTSFLPGWCPRDGGPAGVFTTWSRCPRKLLV